MNEARYRGEGEHRTSRVKNIHNLDENKTFMLGEDQGGANVLYWALGLPLDARAWCVGTFGACSKIYLLHTWVRVGNGCRKMGN